MEGFSIRIWGIIPRVALAVFWSSKQSVIKPVDLRFPQRAGRCRPEELGVRPRGLLKLWMYLGTSDPGQDPIVPRRRSLIFERQPISHQPVWLAFPHCAVRYHSGVLTELYIYGEIHSPPYRHRVALAPFPNPISDRPVGLEFPHHAQRYRPEVSRFSSPGCWGCKITEGFLIWGWMGHYCPRVRRSWGVALRGELPPPLPHWPTEGG